MLVQDLMAMLNELDPDLYATLTLSQLTKFATLAADFFQRTNGAFVTSPNHAPYEFLSQCLEAGQADAKWGHLWHIAYNAIPACHYDTTCFQEQGIPSPHRTKISIIIAENFFKPPTSTCFSCTNSKTGAPITLERRKPKFGYLFDIAGIQTVQYTNFYCRHCNTTYTPSYYSSQDQREYYTVAEGQPENHFQVTQHYFMTHRLADHFNHIQNLAIVSIYNLVNSYNQSHANVKKMYQNNFNKGRYTRRLSANVCSLGLDIHRLMEVYKIRGVRLTGNSKGSDDKRFELAMLHHYEWKKLEGSAYAAHVCSTCTEVTIDEETGTGKIMRSMVTDGITLGIWSCSASQEQLTALDPNNTAVCCTKPLAKVNQRYCPTHMILLHDICHAQPCMNKAIDGTKTCQLEEHIAANKTFKDRNTLLFGLPRRFNRPHANLHMDPSELLEPETGEVVLSEEDRMYSEVEERAHEGARDGGASADATAESAGRKKRILMSRVRTHNEQLALTTCGIIVGRKTFFKSESVPKVKEFIREVFTDNMPEVIFYDNACGLYSHICSNPSDAEAFKNTMLPVDTFHIKSHKELHTTCRLNNDPHLFPELKKPDGGWRFNASAAEITNAWFGRFDAMCQNMGHVRYNFFLDEMIRLHNDRLLVKLEGRPNVTFIGNFDMSP